MKKNFLISNIPGLILSSEVADGFATPPDPELNPNVVGFGVVVKKKASSISFVSIEFEAYGSS